MSIILVVIRFNRFDKWQYIFCHQIQNSAGNILQFELYQPLFTYNVEFYSSSNVNIVEWLVSVHAVQLFLGSAVTRSFGLASCRGYIFDRRAFNVLFQNV